MAYDFSGKVALVTGSSSGIGQDLVIAFAKAGASVVVTGRSAERVKQVAEECLQVSKAATDLKVFSVVADLNKDEDVQKMVNDTISTFGQLDILVNNAGIARVSSFTDDDFMSLYDIIMDTNVRSVLKLTKLVVPHLIQTKGNIINISSTASMRASAMLTPYSISKAALDMVTKCLCLELSPKGVRVNTVNPAAVETPIFEKSGMTLEMIKAREKYPIGRIGQVTDTTAACLYLASKEASFITGINLPVDGGRLLI